jgi:hypothetical protein
MTLSEQPGGYFFTSRAETPEEYRRRQAGQALPAALERAAPDQPGPLRTFRVTAGFAEHNEKLGSIATVIVRRAAAPDRAEAERLIWPAVDEETERVLGPREWWPSLNWLDVVELEESP